MRLCLLLALCAGCTITPTAPKPQPGPMRLAAPRTMRPPPPLPLPTTLAAPTTVAYEPGPTMQAHRGEFGVVVFWTAPDTNVWIPEWSSNMVNWHLCASRGAELPPRELRKAGLRCPDCRYFSDVGTAWTNQWFFRLRRK